MLNPANKRVIVTRDIKWHAHDEENAEKDPTLFEFTEVKVQKTIIRQNVRN